MPQTVDQIDKQLRGPGRVATLLNHPSLTGFKFLNWLLRRAEGQDIAEAHNSTVFVDRSDGTGSIRTRVFRPKNSTEPLPIVLHLHGGGYVAGIPEQSIAQIKGLMAMRPCIVVSPDYRLALQHPYPAGLHDCYDTLVWIKHNAAQLGGRSNQIFVGGESAGGGLTVGVCLMARDKGEVNVAFQLPLYPMLDDRQTTPSAINNTMPVWNSKHNRLAWALYLRELNARGAEIPPYAAPARATSYRGLPPAATFVGELDPFLDETKAYVANLEAAGVPVQFEIFKGGYHGFEQMVPSAEISKAAFAFLHNAFANAVDTVFAAQEA